MIVQNLYKNKIRTLPLVYYIKIYLESFVNKYNRSYIWTRPQSQSMLILKKLQLKIY